MDKHDQSKSEPELVQISIDGNLNYAFKWWDKRTANEHEVRYVFKEPVDGGIFYMMIVCANRIPEGTGLAVVACYPDGTPDTYGYLPAVTEWDNGESDGSSRIMVMRPKDGFPEYRGLPRDLEEMIRDHREGKRQVRRFEKKDTTVDAIKLVEERVYSVQQQVNCLHGEVDKLGEGIGTVRLDIGAIAKNEYELRQENAELQRLQAEGYLKFAAKISGSDFTAFIYIMALGNRKKAADALGIPHRSFYDRLTSGLGWGPNTSACSGLWSGARMSAASSKCGWKIPCCPASPKGVRKIPRRSATL